MLLTISTSHTPATDLGYLLHKHPERCQSFEMSFGQAHVFYPEVSEQRTSAALLLDVDPVGMVRGKNREQNFLLGQYVNDWPYVASSFLSVAISQIFGSAMSGRCKDRPELAQLPIPLTARIDVLPVRGDEGLVQRMFEPLGYTVEAIRHPLDEMFPEWGESPYFSVTISGTTTLSQLLTHLYVLIPVFDNQKHYFVGDDEMEKLLEKGAGWLAVHPEKELITRRYLRHRSNLTSEALERLKDEEGRMKEESGNAAPLDLSLRTKQFALRIIRLYSALPTTTEAQVLGKQLLRSGTSVGAHYREATRSRSTAEFVSKLGGGLQELEESGYWLELLIESGIVKGELLSNLLGEVNELTAILVSCVKNARKKDR